MNGGTGQTARDVLRLGERVHSTGRVWARVRTTETENLQQEEEQQGQGQDHQVISFFSCQDDLQR